MKSRGGKNQRRREDKRRSEKRKSKKKMQVREKVELALQCVFPMVCGPERSTSRLAEAAGAEPSAEMRGEKLHAAVAQSTCRNQNVQNCTKHLNFGALLEVVMWEKCTALWREAHFQVKMYKAPHVWTTGKSARRWGAKQVSK